MNAPEMRNEAEPFGDRAAAALPEIGQIRLAPEVMEAVATGAWGEIVAQKLEAAEWSRRVLLFRHLLKKTGDQSDATGPLQPLTEARRALAEAEHVDPAAVRDVFVHPAVGQWLGDTVRRLGRGAAAAGEGRPLWADLGYAHTIAAVAAYRAGLNATIQVPAYNGQVILPTLGRATISPPSSDNAWQTAEVSTGGGRLKVFSRANQVDMPDRPHEEAPGWEPARQLELVASNGEKWTVLLDDLDHFTSLRIPSVPERLSQAAFEGWRDVLGQAWEELAVHHPEQARQISGVHGLRAIVPAAPKMRFQTYSASSGDSPNSAVMSKPQDPIEAAVTIVHEHCGHNVLNAIQYLLPLLQPQRPGNQEYAPWRDDPRHRSGLMHGVKAFSVVADFWHRRLGIDSGPPGEVAAFEFALWRGAVHKAALELQSYGNQLTDGGMIFLNHLRRGLIEPLLEVPVPPEARLRAHLVGLDHASKWSGHHMPLSNETVAEAAEAWQAGRPLSPEFFETLRDLAPNPGARGLDIASVLARLRMVGPEVLSQPGMLPPEATPADVAFAAALPGRSDMPMGKWNALKQVMGHMLRAQKGTPHDVLSVVYARINRISRESPALQEVTDWLAEGALSYLRRQGDEVLLPRYRRNDERLFREAIADTVRRTNIGEFSAEEGTRLLLALGCLGVGTAASKKLYRPRELYVASPNQLEGTWRPLLTDKEGRVLAGVRAGRVARMAVWSALLGDPNERFQRGTLGRLLLPYDRKYPQGHGGWVYEDSLQGEGYVPVAHKNLIEAVSHLPSEEVIGSVDFFKDDGSFTKEIPHEPGHVVSERPHQVAGSVIVRARDVHALLPAVRVY